MSALGAALGFANVDSGGDAVGWCGYSKSCHPIRECQCGAVVTKVNDAVVKLVRSEMGEMAAGRRCGGPDSTAKL